MTSLLHGKCFSIDKVDQLNKLKLSRDQFLDNDLKKQVSKIIGSGKEILFLGNDVSESFKKNKYQLTIHGILPCGSKTTLAIDGIEPYVDIKFLTTENESSCKTRLNRMIDSIESDNATSTKIEIISGKDFMYYSHEKSKFARVHFSSLKTRSDFLSVCKEQGVKTYSNDKSTYYRVVARDYDLNLSGWNILRNYKRIYGTSSKATYSLTIHINDIEPIADDTSLSKTATAQGFDPSIVKYENMIIAGFDIEMIPEKAGRFPDADKNPKDSIFMICMTYHFVKRDKALLSVCLTLKETNPLDDVVMIHCKSEACLLAAFARFMTFMQPDFITEFNGGGFDWRNIITKAKYFGVISSFLEDMSIVNLLRWETSPTMLNRFHRETEIKIGGATAPAKCKGLKMQGFVAFDTLVVFKQLEPNADSHKLNECLKRCNLGSKDDMDIQEMFRIYREGTKEEMRLVAHYCYIDTFKLQQLLLKKNVVQDRREVANLSYTSIHDNFYYAGGGRMRNLLINRGCKLGYFFDTQYRPTIEDPDAKFPGAFVVPPIKGIVKPALRLDEYVKINNIEYDNASLQEGYQFIEKNFVQLYHSDEDVDPQNAPAVAQTYIDYANKTKNQYPVSGLDFASLYPSIIMAYNISPEKLIVDEEYANELMSRGVNIQFVTFPFCGKMVKAWFVRHDNIEENYSICGKLLIELFSRRASIKKVLKHHGEKIFDMEMEMKPYIASNELNKYPRIEEYNETKFDYVSYDSKQKAVKVFMNTLYGEMGNFLSCICAVEVAASVTTMGRHNLKLIKTFVEGQLNMKTYYGDSVVGDTPIMIKRIKDNVETKELIPIEELDNQYESYNNGKECIDYSNNNVYVMTEDGYSKIVKVIRHRTNKKLYRVTTHIGSVIVTEDHSLLDSNKNKIKPQDCVIGTSLLHWQPDPIDLTQKLNTLNISDEQIRDLPMSDIPNDIAYVKGFFFADGSCGEYECVDGTKKATFALNKLERSILEKCAEIFNNHYTDVQLKIIDTVASSGVYKAVAVGKVLPLVKAWRNDFYSSRKHKKVPQHILDGSRSTKLAFIQGYYAGDGDKTYNRMSNKGQIGSQGLYLLMLDLGYKVSVNVRNDKELIYRLTFTNGKQRCKDITAIKKIEEIGSCEGYVYDLETESHHFAAGVGQMVVHNTDSLYIACNATHFVEYDREYFTGKCDKVQYGKNIVEETFKQIEITRDLVNERLVQDNGSKFLKMAYEEVLYPVAFLSKKKYYGVPHEENVDFYPRKLFIRGLEVVKRGSSGVLKDVVNEVIREVVDLKTTRDLIEIIKDAISKVFSTDWDVDAFAKSKAYRPDKNNPSVITMMERYRAMNYHTIPEPNVRFKCVVCKYYPWTYDIQGRIASKMGVGDRMELVSRVKEENLEIDLEYYFANELTGQLARLITFCKEIANGTTQDNEAIDISDLLEEEVSENKLSQEQEEIDISRMDKNDLESLNRQREKAGGSRLTQVELDAIIKEKYMRSEDALFKAGKKYITQLAKHYSKAYVNKGSLLSNTWREVCNFISARPDIQNLHLNMMTQMVLNMFNNLTGDIHQSLINWTIRHISIRYQVALTDGQQIQLKMELLPVVEYIKEQKLDETISNFMTTWKTNVVQHIRDEFCYDLICRHNLPYDTIWDVLSRQELEIILKDSRFVPAFTADQAMSIVDGIAEGIGKILTSEQLS